MSNAGVNHLLIEVDFYYCTDNEIIKRRFSAVAAIAVAATAVVSFSFDGHRAGEAHLRLLKENE